MALPVRVFLYTLDQLAAILNVEEEALRARYLYFQGLSTGTQGVRMVARNIEADPTHPPRWRVAETELLTYLRRKGFLIDQGRF